MRKENRTRRKKKMLEEKAHARTRSKSRVEVENRGVECYPEREGVAVIVEEVSPQRGSSAVQHFEQHSAGGFIA